MKTNYLLFRMIVILMLVLPACGEEVNEGNLEEALQSMERAMDRMINCDDIDPTECGAYFSGSNEMFKEVMAGDTSPYRIRTANLGAAMTEILQLNEDGEIRNLRNRFTDYFDTASIFNKSSVSKSSKITEKRRQGLLDFRLSPFSASFSDRHNEIAGRLAPIMKVALANPPLVSEVQSVINSKVIPAINYAVARMEFVELDPDFIFKVSPRMQGDPDADTLEMDMTEFKALHGALLSMRAAFKVFTAYNMDVPDYSVETLAQQLSPGSDFLTLKTQHSLSTARTDLMTAADTMLGAIRFLRSEADNQNDDIIKIDTNHLDAGDLDEIEDRLNDIRQGFIQNTTIYDINDYGDSVVVNLSSFFNNPILDVKLKMPDYRVLIKTSDCGKDLRWKFNSTIFPDPHFNGIFPDINTSNDFKRIFDIDIDTVGLETMNAQIDGTNWISCDAWGDGYSNYLIIEGERYDDEGSTYINDHSGIFINNFSGVGTYQLGGNSGNDAYICFHTMTSSSNQFRTDITHTGTLILTRYDDQVIQGTYSFTGYSNISYTTKSVTNGSFYVQNDDGLNKSVKNNAIYVCGTKK